MDDIASEFVSAVNAVVDSKLEGFTAKRDFRGTTYNITVKNESHAEKGVKKLVVDGKEVSGNMIPLSDSKEVNVEVYM